MSKSPSEENIFSTTLIWIHDKLQFSQIPYMITGGAALGFWGHVRSTMDIDIVIVMNKNNMESFLNSIQHEAYVDEDLEGIEQKKIFNVIYDKTAFKIDCIILDIHDGYEEKKFSRRIKLKFKGRELYVISPEDLIISKLLWLQKAGSSERQLKDCESIFQLNKDMLDKKYLLKWIKNLKLLDDYEKIISS